MEMWVFSMLQRMRIRLWCARNYILKKRDCLSGTTRECRAPATGKRQKALRQETAEGERSRGKTAKSTRDSKKTKQPLHRIKKKRGKGQNGHSTVKKRVKWVCVNRYWKTCQLNVMIFINQNWQTIIKFIILFLYLPPAYG